MGFQPKAGAPDYYWLEIVGELRSRVAVDDPRYEEVYAFNYERDMELLTTSEFCSVEPGNPEALTSADFVTGAYKDKYRQAALQSAFYRLCEDEP